MSALVNAVVLGPRGWNTVLLLTMFSVGSLIRTYHLIRGRILVLVDAQTLRTFRRSPGAGG